MARGGRPRGAGAKRQDGRQGGGQYEPGGVTKVWAWDLALMDHF
ncbi:hypothetical protein ABT186_36365 [Streptomyces sp. NPDC001634]